MPMFCAVEFPITVAEMSLFRRQIQGMLTRDEIAELIGFVAFNPTEGDIIPGTGGIRKMRWATANGGKRGGLRIVYFFYDLNMPLYLLAAYPKNKKIDLTENEKKELSLLTRTLVSKKWSEKTERSQS